MIISWVQKYLTKSETFRPFLYKQQQARDLCDDCILRRATNVKGFPLIRSLFSHLLASGTREHVRQQCQVPPFPAGQLVDKNNRDQGSNKVIKKSSKRIHIKESSHARDYTMQFDAYESFALFASACRVKSLTSEATHSATPFF